MRLFFQTVVISFAIVLLSASGVLGCSCETPTQRSAYKKARAVFVGQVLNVKTTSSYTQKTLDYPYAVTFHVEQSWKGVRGDSITILARAPFFQCPGFTFREGARYLVYAYGDDLLVDVSCTQTKLADVAASDLRWLNRSRRRT
jgi:hypothetical protein